MTATPNTAPTVGHSRTSMRRDTAHVLLANTCYSGAQWLVVVALAKLTSSATLGQFALAQAVTTPVLMFTNLDMRSLIATDKRNEFARDCYLSVRWKSTLLAFMLTVALCSYFTNSTAAFIGFTLIAAAKCMESLSDGVAGFFQGHERHDLLAKSLFVRSAASTFAVATAALLWPSLPSIGFALLLSWGAAYLLFDRRALGYLSIDADGPRHTLHEEWRLIRIALPAGAAMFIAAMQAHLPRLFLDQHGSPEAVGIFAALVYPWTVGSLLVQSLGQVAAPRYGTFLAAGDLGSVRRQLLRLLGLGALIGILGVLLAMLLGSTALRLIYTEEYSAHAALLAFLGVASGFGYMAAFLRHASVAMRRNAGVLTVNIISLLCLVLGCTILVPTNGLQGASVALIGMSLVQLAGLTFVVRDILRAVPRL